MCSIFDKICHTCLNETTQLIPMDTAIFSANGVAIEISTMLKKLIKIENAQTQNICNSCTVKLSNAVNFKNQCLESESFLRKLKKNAEIKRINASNTNPEIVACQQEDEYIIDDDPPETSTCEDAEEVDTIQISSVTKNSVVIIGDDDNKTLDAEEVSSKTTTDDDKHAITVQLEDRIADQKRENHVSMNLHRCVCPICRIISTSMHNQALHMEEEHNISPYLEKNSDDDREALPQAQEICKVRRRQSSRCCIETCRKSRRQNVRMYQVSSNRHCFTQWLDACKLTKEQFETSSKQHFICGLHFEKKFMGFRNLVNTAIPTLNLR